MTGNQRRAALRATKQQLAQELHDLESVIRQLHGELFLPDNKPAIEMLGDIRSYTLMTEGSYRLLRQEIARLRACLNAEAHPEKESTATAMHNARLCPCDVCADYRRRYGYPDDDVIATESGEQEEPLMTWEQRRNAVDDALAAFLRKRRPS